MLKHVIEFARSPNMELLLVWPSEVAVTFYKEAGFKNVDDVYSAADDCPPMEFDYTALVSHCSIRLMQVSLNKKVVNP